MAYQGNKRKKQGSSPEEALVGGVASMLWDMVKMVASLFRGKQAGGISLEAKQRLQEAWEQVEINSLNNATQALAISEADKLLDAALQELRVPGATMGERLKASTALFPADLYQQIWSAHKVRNTLAHEIGYVLQPRTAREAVSTFRTALSHLNVF